MTKDHLIERMWPDVLRNFPDAIVAPMKNGQREVTFTVDGHHVTTFLPTGFPVASPAYFWTPLNDEDWIRQRFDEASSSPREY